MSTIVPVFLVKKAYRVDMAETIARGMVIEKMPNFTFLVELSENKQIHAFMSGKMKHNRISVLIGDKVDVVLDPYGKSNRIIKRI